MPRRHRRPPSSREAASIEAVRRAAREGPTATMAATWRDPEDLNPRARAAREVAGYRSFCPLRRMLRYGAKEITERHIMAADKLRLIFDTATIGFSTERDLSLTIGAVLFGPMAGPTRLASRQARAWAPLQRCLGLYTAEQKRMLVHIVLDNHTLQSWAQSFEPARNPTSEMGKLLAVLEIMALHFDAEIEEERRRGGGLIAG